MKKILKLAFVLFLVSAIMSGVLGVVNNMTKDVIEKQQTEKTMQSYKAVLEAPDYEDVTADYTGDSTIFTKIAKASDGSGYVFETYFSGAQGMITMVVGVSSDYTCTGISITNHSETSGLGAVAASVGQDGIDFRAQYVGADNSVALTKNGGTIQAITGATITSAAVTDTVSACINAAESLG